MYDKSQTLRWNLPAGVDFGPGTYSLRDKARTQKWGLLGTRPRTDLNPLVPRTIFGLVLKENASVVKSKRDLDAKCEVQMCPCNFNS